MYLSLDIIVLSTQTGLMMNTELNCPYETTERVSLNSECFNKCILELFRSIEVLLPRILIKFLSCFFRDRFNFRRN